jgi:hypothetical protein
MADRVSGPWKPEDIPSDHVLYRRVQKTDVIDGEPKPRAFRNRADPERPGSEPATSADGSKYSSPEQARDRARVPTDNVAISLNVGRVRAIPEQRVLHSPFFAGPDDRLNNRTHGCLRSEALG